VISAYVISVSDLLAVMRRLEHASMQFQSEVVTYTTNVQGGMVMIKIRK